MKHPAVSVLNAHVRKNRFLQGDVMVFDLLEHHFLFGKYMNCMICAHHIIKLRHGKIQDGSWSVLVVICGQGAVSVPIKGTPHP